MIESTACPEAPTENQTDDLVTLLRCQAARWGSTPLYRFRTEGEPEQRRSFADLDRRARAIGGFLQERADPSDRVLLAYPPGLEFIEAFFGCLYAGVLPVPTTYPKPRRPMPRLALVAADCGAALALSSRRGLQRLDRARRDPELSALRWQASDSIGDEHAGRWQPLQRSGSDLAFLQYTSGSTSQPKGVMISHANLMANLEAIRQAFGMEFCTAERRQVGVFWLPTYHDMGLIGGVLTPLYLGGESVLLSPASFLQRPLRWLEAIHEHQASISGGPNFAYEHCARRLAEIAPGTIDLRCWQLAFCGAEPIQAETLQRFAAAAAPLGFRPEAFYPCYGLAEATLLASGPPGPTSLQRLSVDPARLAEHAIQLSAAGGEAAARTLVGCGQAPPHHQIAIVDPKTRQSLPPGRVGEIWLRGPSVAQGYWNRPEATEKTFAARLATAESESYLRTGDLGFLHEGTLYVTGRRKELIIIRGRNYYPQDIERSAQEAHPHLLTGAAFSVQVDGEEQLVTVLQVERSCPERDHDTILTAVRRRIVADHGIDPYAVSLIRQATLPLTSSGKVQRRLCRRRFQEGRLDLVAQAIPGRLRSTPRPLEGVDLQTVGLEPLARRITDWLLVWLEQQLGEGAEPLDAQMAFADLGVDSLTAVEMSEQLEKVFAVALPAVVAWNYPTPAALGRYLAEQVCQGRENSAAPASTEPERETEPPGDNESFMRPPELATAIAAPDDLEALLREIENLPEEEAARLLSELQLSESPPSSER